MFLFRRRDNTSCCWVLVCSRRPLIIWTETEAASGLKTEAEICAATPELWGRSTGPACASKGDQSLPGGMQAHSPLALEGKRCQAMLSMTEGVAILPLALPAHGSAQQEYLARLPC